MLDTLSFQCLRNILVVLLFSWKGKETNWGLNLDFLTLITECLIKWLDQPQPETTQESVLCFSYRRCQQTLLQAICYAGRSAKGEPSGSQGPVPPHGVLSPAARGHPYPTPQPREASAVPPAAPPPLPAKAAAGLWHLRHSPGEAAVQSCLGEGDSCALQPEERLLLPLLSDICPPSLLWTILLAEGCNSACSHCWWHYWFSGLGSVGSVFNWCSFLSLSNLVFLS